MGTRVLFTSDHLLRMPRDGYRYELVEGNLVRMTPAGWYHGVVAAAVVRRLQEHAEGHHLGLVFSSETGFRLKDVPETVRAPDAAFVSQTHIPASLPPASFWPGAPDLAVEVVSPRDEQREIEERVQDYLQAGSRAVWVIDPATKTVSIWKAGNRSTPAAHLDAQAHLDGEDLLPGFLSRVADLFSGVGG